MDLTDTHGSSERFTRISWTTFVVDGTLLLAATIGACYAWPIQSEAGRLHAKRLELQRQVGEMPINDPTKYHVMLLNSDDPRVFRWRIYVPAKTDAFLSTETRSSTGSSSGRSSFSGSADLAREGLVIATIMPSGDNTNMEIRIHTRSLHSHGSTGMYLNDQTIQKMLTANDTSSWRVAGKDGIEIVFVEDLICLLAIEPLTKDNSTSKTGTLRIELGTQAAIDKSKLQ